LANFGGTESCAIAVDIGNPNAGSNTGTPDGQFDIMVGYPAQLGVGSDRFPCGDAFDTSCFGLYRVAVVTGAEQLGQRFLYKNADVLLTTAFNFPRDQNPSPPAAPGHRVVDHQLQPDPLALWRRARRLYRRASVRDQRRRVLRLVPGQRCRRGHVPEQCAVPHDHVAVLRV
jgi:hypothetical protein